MKIQLNEFFTKIIEGLNRIKRYDLLQTFLVLDIPTSITVCKQQLIFPLVKNTLTNNQNCKLNWILSENFLTFNEFFKVKGYTNTLFNP